jgi:hypothetical protein
MVSPTPSASNVPSPTEDFSEPDHCPRLGDPEVDRMRDLLRQQAVRRNRVRDVGRLDRDLEVLEVERLHQLDELDAGLDSASTEFRRSSSCRCLGSDPG